MNAKRGDLFRVSLEDFVWQKAVAANTIDAIIAYVRNPKYGRHIKEAFQHLEILQEQQREEVMWKKVDQQNKSSLANFMQSFPNGKYTVEARSLTQRLTTSGRDIELRVPILPDSVTDATIANWYKRVGEIVNRDENLCDLETDKVVLEIPSPVDGVLKNIKFKEGEVVSSEQVIATIEGSSLSEF